MNPSKEGMRDEAVSAHRLPVQPRFPTKGKEQRLLGKSAGEPVNTAMQISCHSAVKHPLQSLWGI